MKVVLIILAFCVVGAYSSIFEKEHKDKLREIRNECAVQSGLGPYEIGTVIRAIRPAEKLVNATECIVKTLVKQRDQDEIVADILRRIKIIFEAGILPKSIERIIASCEAIIGPESCQRIISLTQIIIEHVRRNKISFNSN